MCRFDHQNCAGPMVAGAYCPSPSKLDYVNRPALPVARRLAPPSSRQLLAPEQLRPHLGIAGGILPDHA
jgi:hypothetical protein